MQALLIFLSLFFGAALSFFFFFFAPLCLFLSFLFCVLFFVWCGLFYTPFAFFLIRSVAGVNITI